MKVLLLQHVKKLGSKGDIVEVSDGFAINSLFPQKKAVQATPKVLNDHATKTQAQHDKREKEKASNIATIKSVSGLSVEIIEKLNPKGTLYHALGAKEIIRALYDQKNISLNNTMFKKKYALKEAGTHTIVVESEGKTSSFELVIKAS